MGIQRNERMYTLEETTIRSDLSIKEKRGSWGLIIYNMAPRPMDMFLQQSHTCIITFVHQQRTWERRTQLEGAKGEREHRKGSYHEVSMAKVRSPRR